MAEDISDDVAKVLFDNELYLQWKHHAPIMYDSLISSRIEWGTLSCSLGDAQRVATDAALRRHELVQTDPKREEAISNAVGSYGAAEAEDLASGTYRRRIYLAPRTGEDFTGIDCIQHAQINQGSNQTINACHGIMCIACAI